MAPSSKLALIIFLTWTANCYMIVARPLESKPTSSLIARLKLDETPASTGPTCWDSLFQLQSCTGEVIQFFYNGESNLGRDCCQAVYVIGHNCWPAMLSSLGFTSEETALLQGYCDAEESAAPDGDAPSPTNDK